MQRAIIYGVGNRYELLKEELREHFEILGVWDKNPAKLNGENAVDPVSVSPESYDVIVVPGKKYFEEIKDDLRKKGINTDIICFEELLYQEDLSLIKKYEIIKEREGTSFSDLSYFPLFCKAAALDETVFSSFKRHIIFMETVEHTFFEDGLKALKKIESQKPDFTYEQWQSFLNNDSYGKPYTYEYDINGRTIKAGANTLFYIWELQEIARVFGDDIKAGKVKSFAEIGVGFGGLCRLICDYWKDIETYRLVDIPEVLMLAKKFVGCFEINKVVGIDGTSDFDSLVNNDLVISNFAFSELIRDVQEKYIDKIVSKSQRGFIIWNPLSEIELDGMTLEEFMQRVPNARKEYNEVLGDAAYIVTWR